jgi:heme/copper-type cytochrome/quinol oxidase subunit 2
MWGESANVGIEGRGLWAYLPKMTFGTSLLLIAVGAILRYAVTATVSGVDLHVVGLVLMIVGVVGLVFSLLWIGVWSGRRREVPPVEREVRDRNIY